jgi:hypothetical protein
MDVPTKLFSSVPSTKFGLFPLVAISLVRWLSAVDGILAGDAYITIIHLYFSNFGISKSVLPT